MTPPAVGRLAGAALLALAAAPATGAALGVFDDEGRRLAAAPLGPDGRWCLLWNHSATGIAVADCFRLEGSRMVLETSHQPDFAAGLGESPGAAVRPDGAGGYRLEGLDRPVPASGLVLRRASPAVDQRIAIGDAVMPLPPGPRGARLVIRPAGHGPGEAGRCLGRAGTGRAPAAEP